jgi:hypothetical protein
VKSVRFWIIPLALLFPLQAQDSGPAAEALEGRWESLRQVKTGQVVQVVQMDLKSFTGPLAGVSGDAIRLLVKKREVEIARPAVFRVSVRSGSRRARNALIGLAVGAGIGAGLGAGVAAGLNAEEFTAPIIAGSTLAIGGAGAGVAAAFPGYATIYRAPKRAAPATP